MARRIKMLSDMWPLFNTGFARISIDILTRLSENRTMKQLTFAEAVEDKVQEFIDANKPFSNQEIKVALRADVNNNLLELTDRTKEDVDGNDTFNIDHNEVRNVIQCLWRNNSMDVTRSHNGTFFVYTPVQKPTLPQKGTHYVTGMCPPTSMPKANLAAIGSRATATCCGVPTQSCVPLPSKSLADQLKDYFLTLSDEGYCKVTIKQIQSRFKNLKGVTCEKYADVLTSLGYAVDNSTPYPSKWTVVI